MQITQVPSLLITACLVAEAQTEAHQKEGQQPLALSSFKQIYTLGPREAAESCLEGV